MTIAFQFAFESHMQETVASMARHYVRSIISSVQRAALVLTCLRRPWSHFKIYVWRRYSMIVVVKTSAERLHTLCIRDLRLFIGGICLSSMSRPISYERAMVWKVLNEDDGPHCLCFMFINWSFV
ncbi:hypothetical protein SASPL_123210 [Salvia splendens]|uniref:MEKHLA domain-containing protein n=1 Tax=Salvia splendens TaxID=180675 RepID=A0A8X8XN20_SALSN|nr:hypothetical protein SASPL_123210 [Salvia splendens]